MNIKFYVYSNSAVSNEWLKSVKNNAKMILIYQTNPLLYISPYKQLHFIDDMIKKTFNFTITLKMT